MACQILQALNKNSLTWEIVVDKYYIVTPPNFMRLLKKQIVARWWG
jgi:hypothetical protein